MLHLEMSASEVPRGFMLSEFWSFAHKVSKALERNPNATFDDLLSDLPGSDNGELYVRVVFDYVTRDREVDHYGKISMQRRLELIKILKNTRSSSHAKRERVKEYVLACVDHFTGLERLLALGHQDSHGTSLEYLQLEDDTPWWRPGDLVETHEVLAEALEQGIEPTSLGFARITRQRYLDMVRAPVSRLLLMQPDALSQEASIVALMTATRTERSRMGRLTQALRSDLVLRLSKELEHRTTPIPQGALFGLARELNNLGSFYISRDDTLQEVANDSGTKVITVETPGSRAAPRAFEAHQLTLVSWLEGARARVIPKEHARKFGLSGDEEFDSVVFYDKELVDRGERLDQFIEVKVSHEGSVLDSIIQAMEHLELNAAVLEDVPRVAAGFFNAAQKDRRLAFNQEGTFWDTETGRRVCRLIGFNEENARHRARVRQVRDLLERITLHREITEIDHTGKYRRVKWSGPLIESRREQISIEEYDREGLTNHNTFRAWSIASALWSMTKPKDQGGAPAYMALDERAFALEARSSASFNIYWTLINRAYISKRLTADGELSLKVGTLTRWAGLEGSYERPAKLQAVLRKKLDLLVEHGLLDSWTCPELGANNSVSYVDLLGATLSLVFSDSQMSTLRYVLEHRKD